MSSSGLTYSKSKIDKAGELLKSKSVSDNEKNLALDILSYWRIAHAIPLNSFAKVLKARSQKVSTDFIVAQRLKRTPSVCLSF